MRIDAVERAIHAVIVGCGFTHDDSSYARSICLRGVGSEAILSDGVEESQFLTAQKTSAVAGIIGTQPAGPGKTKRPLEGADGTSQDASDEFLHCGDEGVEIGFGAEGTQFKIHKIIGVGG